MGVVLQMQNKKLVNSPDYLNDELDTHDITLLSMFGEVWYDHRDLFDELFIKNLFNSIRKDPYIKDTYTPSNKERELIKSELANSVFNTTVKVGNAKAYNNYLNKAAPAKFGVSAAHVLSQIRFTLSYDTSTLIILGHPEHYMGDSLGTSCIVGSKNSLLHESLKYMVVHYEDDSETDAKIDLSPEDFSFDLLRDAGIVFGYEVPVYTSATNRDVHSHYWGQTMSDFYTKLLTLHTDLKIVTLGCSKKFNTLIKELTTETGNEVIKMDSIFKTDSPFSIDDYVLTELGELIASCLVVTDYDLRSSEKILRYARK